MTSQPTTARDGPQVRAQPHSVAFVYPAHLAPCWALSVHNQTSQVPVLGTSGPAGVRVEATDKHPIQEAHTLAGEAGFQ